MKDVRDMEIQIDDVVGFAWQPYSSGGLQILTGRVIKLNPKSVKVMRLNADGSDYLYPYDTRLEDKREYMNVINPGKKVVIIGIVE